MLKKSVLGIITILIDLTIFGAVTTLWQFAGPSEMDRVRSHRDMSAEEQREVLQMFFPKELPGQLLDVRIESFLPAKWFNQKIQRAGRVTTMAAAADLRVGKASS